MTLQTPGFNTLIVLDARKDHRVSAEEDAAQWDAIAADLSAHTTNPHEIASIAFAVRQMQRAMSPIFVRKGEV